jgi:hypothetical protein
VLFASVPIEMIVWWWTAKKGALKPQSRTEIYGVESSPHHWLLSSFHIFEQPSSAHGTVNWSLCKRESVRFEFAPSGEHFGAIFTDDSGARMQLLVAFK